MNATASFRGVVHSSGTRAEYYSRSAAFLVFPQFVLPTNGNDAWLRGGEWHQQYSWIKLTLPLIRPPTAVGDRINGKRKINIQIVLYRLSSVGPLHREMVGLAGKKILACLCWIENSFVEKSFLSCSTPSIKDHYVFMEILSHMMS